MPQVQEVVRCYNCETFQAQIQKKIKKWTCKVCQEKQSLKKVYFTGLGAETRKVVMEYNMKRGEAAELKSSLLMEEPAHIDQDENSRRTSPANVQISVSGSKWSAFLPADTAPKIGLREGPDRPQKREEDSFHRQRENSEWNDAWEESSELAGLGKENKTISENPNSAVVGRKRKIMKSAFFNSHLRRRNNEPDTGGEIEDGFSREDETTFWQDPSNSLEEHRQEPLHEPLNEPLHEPPPASEKTHSPKIQPSAKKSKWSQFT